MGLPAGKLDRRIRLERFVESRDEYNEPVKNWTLIANRSASYKPKPDGEKFRAGETAADVSAWFVIRWSQAVADLNPKDQLIFEGAAWAITGVKEIGRREGIEITAIRRADG